MFGNNDSSNQPQDGNAGYTPTGPPTFGQPPVATSDSGQTLPPPVMDNPVAGNTDPVPSDTTPTPADHDDLLDSNSDDSELIDIKQKALQQLSPLVGHLEQTPEEKFRTMMMMIQASDDQSLLKSAYEAAEQIQGEKERAQALLDIINEINYFTQQKVS